ncbi:ParA family protein [Microvirga massiliensis]|uniref:ParA family protein n=1 Tax=Microvirga massiliensis TaxID=1033741 RepID=UPI00062B4422|nr:ParA family protein [Microvirga massiliensis]
MAVIPFVSSKGGAGKSTSALILATQLAARGSKVTVLDCDQNQHCAEWYAEAKNKSVAVVGDITYKTVVEEIEKAHQVSDVVIVDLQGSQNMTASRAISRATMVLIPLGATHLDAKEATKSVGLVQDEEVVLRRAVPYRAFFTKCRPKPTIEERKIKDNLLGLGVPMLQTRLLSRVAYENLFSYAVSLSDYADQGVGVSGVEEAIRNADEFVDDVVAALNDLDGDARAAA